MPQVRVGSQGKSVTLDDSNFAGQGGEGAVHVIGDTAYKLCNRPPNVDKLRELARLKHDRVVAPQHVLYDAAGSAAGYSMQAVPGSMPLATILTKAYRERKGLSHADMARLVQQIADGYRYLHSQKMLQVDGNTLNYMVMPDHSGLYFIDAASFQTPNFPANAIMASIRDWEVLQDPGGRWQWSELSDWWSYAIVSWEMFCGIHPFKARHGGAPGKLDLEAQMKACKSVLSKGAQVPKGAVYWPFERVIPGGRDGAYMQWYRALFVDGKRLPPPDSFQATAVVLPQVAVVATGDAFTLSPVGKYVSATHLLEPGVLEWMETEGRLYARRGNDICEVETIHLQSGATRRVMTSVAQIMPAATTCFDGVVFQQMLGATIASVFPASGVHRQARIKELAGHVVTAAKHERGVLMIMALCRATGQTNRFVLRFRQPDYASYDCRIDEDVLPGDANMATTEAGVCVCIPEDGVVELFSAKPGAAWPGAWSSPPANT